MIAIVRIFPGITALLIILFLVSLGFSVCYYVILGNLIPEMSHFLGAFLFTTSQSLFSSEAYLELI